MKGGGPDGRAAALLFALALAAGAVLRFPGLAERPMHADEAILADKLGTLLETGSYRYDPGGYHGPALLYLTLPFAWAAGQSTYSSLTETALRAAPAAAGLLLVAAPLLLAGGIGRLGAAFAALLTALSPAMVYYSRYYIPEIPLTLFVFAAAALWLHPAGGIRRAVLAGIAAGAAGASKETAVLAFAALPVAAMACGLKVDARRAAAALAAAAATGTLLLTAFLGNPRGAADFLGSYFATYWPMGSGASGHVHPWYYYIGTLWRAEHLLLAAAAVALPVMLRKASAPAARFFAVFAVALLAVYSALPYKTPWCLLAFWQPALIAAGAGAAGLLGAARGKLRALVAVALAALAVTLAIGSWRLSRPLAASPGNPYAYAHTGPGVRLIRERIEALARVHPDGARMRIQVFATPNWWPLPWYLRSFPNAGWSRGVSAERPAQVILASPDLEPALTRKLYEEPPPGERELYVHLFPEKVELRPGVEVRGYAARGLWEAQRGR